MITMITRSDFRSAQGLAALIAGIALGNYFLLAMAFVFFIDAIRLSEGRTNPPPNEP